MDKIRTILKDIGFTSNEVEIFLVLLNGGQLTTNQLGCRSGLHRQVCYDALNRLINVTAPVDTTDYTYDSVGNRLTMDNNGVITSYTYDDDNRILSAGTTTYSHDNAGNLLSKQDASGTTSYTYDYHNRLVQVSTPSSIVNYTYSGIGNRKSQDNGTLTYYYYDALDLLMEFSNTGVLQREYVYGPMVDELSSIVESGQRYYQYLDAHNSVVNIVDGTMNPVSSYTYDAFGMITSGNVADQFIHKYTGVGDFPEKTIVSYPACFSSAPKNPPILE